MENGATSMSNQKLRILTFSTLYPSSVRPGHGIFVETRLRELLKSGQVEAKVVAPVPWFFSRNPCFGGYAQMAATPRYELRNGVEVWHPRYLLPPRIGMNIAPRALVRGSMGTINRLRDQGFDFDLIDAHYFYPDGVAAAMIGKALNKPVVITARGTDINLIPKFAKPRKMILEAARESGAMITVCRALKDELVTLGADENKIVPLRNGVDLERFFPEDRTHARATFGVGDRFAIASVGYLIERKGHHLAIQAMQDIPDGELLIAGSGEEEAELRRLAKQLGVENRVRFLGALPQERLRTLYSAADCLLLASSREGWANVLLEAMACGTPVVASNVWGTPEVVASPEAGILMLQRSAKGIVDAVGRLRHSMPSREATRYYAEQFSWEATSRGQIDLFNHVLGAPLSHA